MGGSSKPWSPLFKRALHETPNHRDLVFFQHPTVTDEFSSSLSLLLNITSPSNLAAHFIFPCNYAAYEQLYPRSDLPCSLLSSFTINDTSTAVASSLTEKQIWSRPPNSKMWTFTPKSLQLLTIWIVCVLGRSLCATRSVGQPFAEGTNYSDCCWHLWIGR